MSEPKRSITIDDYDALKIAYDKAVEEEREVFTFKGASIVTDYAKYVLIYFEKLKSKTNEKEATEVSE